MTGRSANLAVGLTVAVGVIAIVIGTGIDGFVGGLFQGAGVALAVLGAYGLGMRHRAERSGGRDDEPAAWLPSRDGNR